MARGVTMSASDGGWWVEGNEAENAQFSAVDGG